MQGCRVSAIEGCWVNEKRLCPSEANTKKTQTSGRVCSPFVQLMFGGSGPQLQGFKQASGFKKTSSPKNQGPSVVLRVQTPA